MTTVTLTGSNADNLCYLGAQANASSMVTNPEIATSEFSDANYASGSVDDGDYAKVTATVNTSLKFANVAHRFTFDLTPYNTTGSMVTGIKIYYDGYRVNGVTCKIQHKSGSGWTDDSITIPDTSDGAGWEYEGSTLTNVDDIIISNTFEFGAIVGDLCFGEAVTVELHTDAAQIDVTYENVISDGIFKVSPGTWDYGYSNKHLKILPRLMSYTCRAGSWDFSDEYSGEYRIRFILPDLLTMQVSPVLSSFESEKFKVLPKLWSLEDKQMKVLPKLVSLSEKIFKTEPKLSLHTPLLFEEKSRTTEHKYILFDAIPKFMNTNETLPKILPRFTSYRLETEHNRIASPFSSEYSSADFRITLYYIGYEMKFKVYPATFTFTDQSFKVYPQFIENYKLFKVEPRWTGPIRDPILNIMLLLKNNWNLSESGVSSSDITFSTGWYDNNLVTPQITVTPAYNRKAIQETGDKPLYKFEDTSFVNVWVRPKTESGKSLGWAKHADYVIREEVARILRTGSHIGVEDHNQEFMFMGPWRRLDETDVRPIVLRSLIEVKNNYYRSTYEVV